MIPQLIILALVFLGLGIDFSKHGQLKTGKHDGWVSFIAFVITQSLLYWGGFYDVFIK